MYPSQPEPLRAPGAGTVPILKVDEETRGAHEEPECVSAEAKQPITVLHSCREPMLRGTPVISPATGRPGQARSSSQLTS